MLDFFDRLPDRIPGQDRYTDLNETYHTVGFKGTAAQMGLFIDDGLDSHSRASKSMNVQYQLNALLDVLRKHQTIREIKEHFPAKEPFRSMILDNVDKDTGYKQ